MTSASDAICFPRGGQTRTPGVLWAVLFLAVPLFSVGASGVEAQRLSEDELFRRAVESYRALPDNLSAADAPEFSRTVSYLFAYRQRDPRRLREDRQHGAEVARALAWLLSQMDELRPAITKGDVPVHPVLSDDELRNEGLSAYRRIPGRTSEISALQIEDFVTAQSHLYALRQRSPQRAGNRVRRALARLDEAAPRLTAGLAKGDFGRPPGLPETGKPAVWGSDVAADAGQSRRTLYIRGARNPPACFHKRTPDWDNGNNVHLWSCSAGRAMMKTWVYDRRNGYLRAAMNRDMCLHKQQRGWDNGNNVHLWECSAGANEMKTWVYDRRTGYIRAALNPDMCLHKQRPGWDNGNNIHLWACDAGSPEMKTWRLTSPR